MSDCKIHHNGNKFVKIFSNYKDAELSYNSQKFVYDAGLPVPAVLGLTKLSETEIALEMEYIEGKTLTNENTTSEQNLAALQIMAKLQCQINAVDASNMPPLTNSYTHEITTTPYLSAEIKNALLRIMKQLNSGKTNLCHGDIHPHNIMFDGEKHWIIDWEDACYGDPAADACMTYFYTMRWDAKFNNHFAEYYLSAFCEESEISHEDVLAWLPVIAGVQVNINDEDDRLFIENFISEWYTKNLSS